MTKTTKSRRARRALAFAPYAAEDTSQYYDYHDQQAERRNSRMSNSSGHRELARYVSQGAGAAIGFAEGGFPGAQVGAQLGGVAYDVGEAAYNYMTVDDAFDAAYPNKKEMGGTYKGRFSRVAAKSTWDDMVMKKGFHCTVETFGSVSDPNAVYLQHTTWDADRYAYAFCGAALRKLFKKSGIAIDDKGEIIPLNAHTNGQNFVVEYLTQEPTTGVIDVIGAVTITTSSLTGLLEVTFPAFKQSVELFFNKGDDKLPYALLLYSADITTLGPPQQFQPRLHTRLDLSNEIVSFYAVSDIKVQNRTAADSTAETPQYETDRVDAQPLYGSVYNFSSDPKLKIIGIYDANALKLNGIPASGMYLTRAQDFNDTTYQNRPSKDHWSNCVSRNNVVLNPGNIKKGAAYIKISGRLKSMFAKMRHEAGTNILHGVRCKSQLYIFEECIRSVTTNHIKVQYERKLRVGCMLKTVVNDIPLSTKLISNSVSV